MVYQLENIKQDVRVCMDENRTDDSLIIGGDEETIDLDAIIESKVLEAVRRVHSEAPYYFLEQGHNFTSSGIFWNGTNDTSGWLLLPNDFLRMVVFEMSDWERPAYNALTVDDPDYAKQRSRIKGIRGSVQRPVVAVAVRPEGKVLEFYSCNSRNATISKAVYIPMPEFDVMNSVEICERCYQAVVYTVAALTLVSMGETEKANAFFENTKTLLEG
jgi:hypothetical protein